MIIEIIEQVVRDGRSIWKLKCPGCGAWGEIDNDQFHGRVSVDCVECDYHETKNWQEVENSKESDCPSHEEFTELFNDAYSEFERELMFGEDRLNECFKEFCKEFCEE